MKSLSTENDGGELFDGGLQLNINFIIFLPNKNNEHY